MEPRVAARRPGNVALLARGVRAEVGGPFRVSGASWSTLPRMARQELLYRGRLDIGDGNPRPLEVWMVDDAAVVFDGGAVVARAVSVTVGWTDDRRLLITGADPDSGAPLSWEGPDPLRVEGVWHNVRVRWPDGSRWIGSTVTWSQYGVTVSRTGHPNLELAGARVVVEGGQKSIVYEGAQRAVIEARRSCGCSGGK